MPGRAIKNGLLLSVPLWIMIYGAAQYYGQDMPQITNERVLAKVGLLQIQNDVLGERVATLTMRVNQLEIENKKLTEELEAK